MKRRTNKGFTLTELLIVIVIIGILVAILIPVLTTYIKKARVATEKEIVRNINMALKSDEETIKSGEQHKTMYDALQVAKEVGYDVAKINNTKYGNEILWDSKNDVFCYLNNGNIEYIPEYPGQKPTQDVDYFRIASDYESTDKKYSVYLSGINLTGEITDVSTGLDVGENTNIQSITYDGGESSQAVIIRSNGGTLTVNAPNDTVSHYGFATVVNANDVDDNCYDENGTVGRLIYSDNDGKIYFGDTAFVYCYMNTSTDTAANAEFSGVKAENAIVYTYVDSGEDEAKGYAAADNKEGVTVTDGIVEISTCFNHNEDYDIIN